jgi:hypothetical protein
MSDAPNMILRAAARANCEMSVLLQAVAQRDAHDDDLVYKAAAVVLHLQPIAAALTFDLRRNGRNALNGGCGFLLIDLGLGQPADFEQLLCTANLYLGKLMGAAAGAVPGYIETECGRVVAILEQFVSLKKGDLWFVVQRVGEIHRGAA